MRQRNAYLCSALMMVLLATSPAWALLAGFNVDIHMDIDPTGRTIANDFHIEGTIKSGPPLGAPGGGGWAHPPKLVWQMNDLFPSWTGETNLFQPDTTDPDENTWLFHMDWWFPPGSPEGYVFCQVLHLGLLFDVECHNTVIDLVGWWTWDGEPLQQTPTQGPTLNGGAVLIPGFDVQDQGEPQRIQIRNDSGKSPVVPGINATQVLAMDLLVLKKEEM